MSAPSQLPSTVVAVAPQSSPLVPIASTFASGIAFRSFLGASFVLTTILLTYLIEHAPLGHAGIAAAAPDSGPATTDLHLASTFAVKSWMVAIDGKKMVPRRSSEDAWMGTVATGHGLLIQAVPEDEGDVRWHGVQMRVTQGSVSHEYAFWGNGAVIGSTELATP